MSSDVMMCYKRVAEAKFEEAMEVSKKKNVGGIGDRNVEKVGIVMESVKDFFPSDALDIKSKMAIEKAAKKLAIDVEYYLKENFYARIVRQQIILKPRGMLMDPLVDITYDLAWKAEIVKERRK